MILLGLSARPHLDSGQQALGTKLTLPADFTSREELDRADFYKQLQKVRDSYRGPYKIKLRGTNLYLLEGGNES